MLIIRPSKIYISSANVDMRKSIDGLSAIVEEKFTLNPISDMMFVFHNRHCDKIKILYWDTSGFCLLYKRIEKGKIRFPKHITEEKYTVIEGGTGLAASRLAYRRNQILRKLKSPKVFNRKSGAN